MLKVLLVDDEYIILKGMETMLAEQEILPLELYTSLDSIKALSQVQTIKPDVIIADINMPEVDGLTMIQQIQESGYTCKYILCTGYDELDYLHRAIQYQVVEYMLKPVDKALLLEKLIHIHRQKQSELMDGLLRVKMHLLEGRSELPLSDRELRHVLPFPYYAVVTAMVKKDANVASSPDFGTYFTAVHILQAESMRIYLLNTDVELPQSQLQDTCALVMRNTELLWGCSLMYSLEGLTGTELACSTAYLEAVSHMLLQGLPLEAEAVSRLEAVPAPPRWIVHGDGSQESFKDYLDELYGKLNDTWLVFSVSFVHLAAGGLSYNVSPPELRCPNIWYREDLPGVSDRDSLERALRARFKKLIPDIKADVDFAPRDKIRRSLDYIRQHYQQDLSLDWVASQVMLHPSYFSSLFKKNTGISFLQHLHTVRLEAACRLMQESPDLAIETVARLSGYRTTSHFHKAFKFRFKMSPREWLVKQDRQRQ